MSKLGSKFEFFRLPEGSTLRILPAPTFFQKHYIRKEDMQPSFVPCSFAEKAEPCALDDSTQLQSKACTLVSAVKVVPKRVHDKHKGRASYHARIQKKWDKRFGTVGHPVTIVASKGLVNKLKELASRVNGLPVITNGLEEQLKREYLEVGADGDLINVWNVISNLRNKP